MRIRWFNYIVQFNVGYTISPEKWDSRNGRCKKNITNKSGDTAFRAVLSYPDEVGFLVAAEGFPLGVPVALHGVVGRFLAGGGQGGHDLAVERAPSLAHIAVALAEVEADDAPLQLVFQAQVHPCGSQRLAPAKAVLACKLPCEAHQLL